MFSNAPYLGTALTTLAVVMICVLFHYEGLRLLGRGANSQRVPSRRRIVSLILGQLVLHGLEICLFALAYGILANTGNFGEIAEFAYQGSPQEALSGYDMVYFSAAVYTTLGFGDIVAQGPLRLMTGAEAVVGLVMITWSASYTFLEMTQHWSRD